MDTLNQRAMIYIQLKTIHLHLSSFLMINYIVVLLLKSLFHVKKDLLIIRHCLIKQEVLWVVFLFKAKLVFSLFFY